MAAALKNNGDNNGVDGSRHCCCHVPAIVLDTLGVKHAFSLEECADSGPGVSSLPRVLTPGCQKLEEFDHF